MNLSLLISKIEKEVENCEKKIKEIIKKSNDELKINIDLEEYNILESLLENDIILNIKEIYKRNKAIKICRKNLYDKFLYYDKKRNEFIHKLNKIIYSDDIIKNINAKEIIKNLGKNNSLEENQNIKFYNNICNIIIKNIDYIIINKLINNIDIKNIKKIPEFINYDLHKIIKQKIYIEWSLNYRVLLKDLILQNNEYPDFNYLYNLYQDFFNNKITLFDNNYLFETQEENLKFKTILFNSIIISNPKISNLSSNQKAFLNNATKYLLLFGFDKNKCRFSQIITNAIKNKSNEIKDKIFKELLYYINRDKNEKILIFIIWCLSMIFNNILIYDEKENIISFSPYLNCSPRTKNFFYNFLKNLDNYIIYYNLNFNNISLEYNAQIENYVLAELTKSYTKVLYDEQNKYKINITGKKVFKLIQKLNKSGTKIIEEDENIFSYINNNEDSDDELIEEYYDCGPLDEIESFQLYKLFIQFVKKYIILENQNVNNNNIINQGKSLLDYILCNNKGNNLDKNELNFDEENNNIKIKFNFDNDLLIPIDILNTATQIMICISSDENYNFFKNIINQRNIENIDYYIYNCFSLNNNYNNISKENIAKIYGKLLAYIISSKEIFKFQSISFLVLGKGDLVLKSCLDELNTKINNIIDITDLIQDIILIDSNSNFNLELKQNFINIKLIAGKLINIYINKESKIIIPINKKFEKCYSIVGINPNNDKINNIEYITNCLPEIYNFDMENDLNVYNTEYIFEINNILKKVKEKIYENYY